MKEKNLTLDLALEESARCLLCYDAPCTKACPVGTKVSEFIRSLRFKNVRGAAATIRNSNPLACLCAETSPRKKLSEGACIRNKLDKNVEIMKLQKFLMQHTEAPIIKENNMKVSDKIAILGSGPVALSTAGTLLKKGYEVTIFENEDFVGEWMYNIVSNESLQCDLDYLKKLGLKIQTNSGYNEEILVSELRKSGYKAIVMEALNYEYNKTDDLFIFPEIEKVREKIVYSVRAGKLLVEEIIYNLEFDKLSIKKSNLSMKEAGV